MSVTAVDSGFPCARAALSEQANPPPPDDVLAGQAQAGDAAALEALIQRYRERIRTFTLGILLDPEDAEDVTQETFLRVCAGLASYRAHGQFRGWIYRIAANLCRDRQRARRRRPTVPHSEAAVEVASGTAGRGEELALREAVRAAIARLPLKYREVVTLHYLEELSPAEIAMALGRPRTAVRVQLWRARRLLVEQLAGWLD